LRLYLDANIFVYAVGGDSPQREPCRQVLLAVADGRFQAETSAYTVQEVVRQRHRRGDSNAIARARRVLKICSRVHAVDAAVARTALDALERYPSLDISDAVHVATTTIHELPHILSADRDLDQIDGVERVDPLDTKRLEALIEG
jgi:hypothetical protein